MRQLWCCLLVTTSFVVNIMALDNGLALTPPMGWMDWERFRCITDCKQYPDSCISEQLIKQMGDRMAKDGFRDAGYTYVSIDDCWLSKKRDKNGKLQPDPERFPSGIKALADYLHNLGLKLGIYEDFGKKTCAGYPGSEFSLMGDAQTFADWGVDMLKLDGCNADKSDMEFGYPAMGFFLNKTNRPILYSCSWPAYTGTGPLTNYSLIKTTCNLWRNYADVQDSWDSVYGIIQYYGQDPGNFSTFAGPGSWNDPDQLILGNYGLSYEQERVQMGMWAIMASPLFMSVDLRQLRDASKALLLNKRVLAINQDALGVQGTRKSVIGKFEVWTKPLRVKGSYAFAILNGANDGNPRYITITMQSLGLANSSGYNITEVFDGKHIGVFKPADKFKVSVNPTGIVLYTAAPVK